MIQLLKVCGNITGIPNKIPKLTSEIFLLIEIAIPILLVVMGTIDLFKGVTAGKEDDMIKGRKLFGKRLITGALVFIIIAVTKTLIGFVDSENSPNILACMDCFLNDHCTIGKAEKDTSKICTIGGYEINFAGSKPTFANETLSKNGYYINKSDFVSTDSMPCPDSRFELKSAGIYNAHAYDIVRK